MIVDSDSGATGLLLTLMNTDIVKTKYRRTKTGCITCRLRRIKCDEVRPECINCSDRELTCVWFDKEPTPGPSTPPITERPGITIPPLNVANLQVLHHFIISTSRTIPHPSIPNTMLCDPQIMSPMSVFSPRNSFLAHSILCAGAIHLALQTNKPEYRILAESHFHFALALAKIENRLDTYDRNSMSPRQLGNDLLIAYLSVTGCVESRMTFSEIVVLICRGMVFQTVDLLPREMQTLSISVSAMLTTGPAIKFPTEQFLALVNPLTCIDPDELLENALVYSAYHAAVVGLEFTWRTLTDPQYVTTGATALSRRWATTLPARFLTLLLERRQRALIILAHYSAIITSFLPMGYWYLTDVRQDLVKIAAMIQPRWIDEMSWPLSVLESVRAPD